jgi:dihydropteroate synthase
MARLVPVGIVNCTPDSFSDGMGPLVDPSTGDRTVSTRKLIDKAQELLDAGAQLLDVGGDSTRPDSRCTDDEEEWRRIEPILSHFSHKVPVSVDTHKAEIARRAIDRGATMINDITGGIDSQLVEAVARSSVRYAYMFNAYGDAHCFRTSRHHISPSSAVSLISAWAQERSQLLAQRGIPLERQVMDTGIGGFVSPDPAVSFAIIESYWEITCPCTSRLLGCSRKGFLRQPNETSLMDRDALTARIGATVARAAPETSTLYLRVHDVARQLREIADSAPGISLL